MKKNYFIFLVYISNCGGTIDLEELFPNQNIVLETKRIILPDYPEAFNPSIIRWQDKLLLSFRVIPDPKHSFTSWIGLVWLDNNFEPLGTIQKLTMRPENSTIPPRLEDARLITINNKLYLIYTDNEDPIISKGGFRLFVAELVVDGEQFIIKHKEKLSSFEGNNPNRREKNWVPFNYNSSLLLAYSLVPHRILQPVLENTGHCETLVSSESSINWEWGELRGGTPALLDGDYYLSFFHSSQRMTSIHSNDKDSMHYFIGAYLFSKDLPFNITHISKEPIIGKDFYHGAQYKPYWGPVNVVFPCGYIIDGDYIWIAYGRQDRELWVAKLDKKKLYESLVPLIAT